MTATAETSWTALEHLTSTMCAAANDQDWVQVLELSVERHKTLLDHFQRFPVGPDNAEFYHRHLSAMVSGEQRLHALAQQARKHVMREGLDSQRNQRALGAYRNN